MRHRSPILALALAALASGTACGGRSDPTPSPAPSRPAEAAPPAKSSACDVAALREASTSIAERWSSWSPRTGTPPDLELDVFGAVWTHCPKLPDGAKAMIDLAVDHHAVSSDDGPAVNDPLDARLPGHARLHERNRAPMPAMWEWHGAICPGYAELASELAQLPGGDREAVLWDRCLYRYDIVTREEYLATYRHMGTLGIALYHWLTEAGVDRATAGALARPVVLARDPLLRLPGGLLLPAAEVPTKLDVMHVDMDMVIELRPSSIHYHGKVATLDAAGRIVAEGGPAGSERIVPDLYGPLAGDFERITMQAERNGERGSGLVLLAAHRELPWSTLRPVLATVLAARIHRVALLALADDRADPLRLVMVVDGVVDDEHVTAAWPSVEAFRGTLPPNPDDATTVQELVDGVLAHPTGPGRVAYLTWLWSSSPR